MKTKKKFDCVEMKQHIQEEILNEFKGVDEKEAFQKQMDRISRNPRLSAYLKKTKGQQHLQSSTT